MNEVRGRHLPQQRVVPAQECFGALHAACARVQARLEVQAELVVRQRLAQLAFHGLAGLYALVGLGREEARHVAPCGLGLVHGGVGAAHQFVLVGGIVGVQGHTHAARHGEVVALHQCGLADGRNQALVDHLVKLVAVCDVAQDDDELVAAQAAHGVVCPHRLRQPARHGAQQTVANVVTQRVIDQLEPVQIDEQHRHLLAIRAGLCQRVGQSLLAHGAIRQLGEHIVLGQKRMRSSLALRSVMSMEIPM